MWTQGSGFALMGGIPVLPGRFRLRAVTASHGFRPNGSAVPVETPQGASIRAWVSPDASLPDVQAFVKRARSGPVLTNPPAPFLLLMST